MNFKAMNIYKCNKCEKIVKRDSTKKWIPSYCDELGLKTRLYLQKQK